MVLCFYVVVVRRCLHSAMNPRGISGFRNFTLVFFKTSECFFLTFVIYPDYTRLFTLVILITSHITESKSSHECASAQLYLHLGLTTNLLQEKSYTDNVA